MMGMVENTVLAITLPYNVKISQVNPYVQMVFPDNRSLLQHNDVTL